MCGEVTPRPPLWRGAGGELGGEAGACIKVRRELSGAIRARAVPPELVVTLVVFACVHNAGRSQMSAAFFNLLADPAKARALSAGTQPGARVHPEVLLTMREVGLDLAEVVPQQLTTELASGAGWLVTMGCGEACPHVPGLLREDWPLEDPKGKSVERVREIRDDVRRRVSTFVAERGWGA